MILLHGHSFRNKSFALNLMLYSKLFFKPFTARYLKCERGGGELWIYDDHHILLVGFNVAKLLSASNLISLMGQCSTPKATFKAQQKTKSSHKRDLTKSKIHYSKSIHSILAILLLHSDCVSILKIVRNIMEVFIYWPQFSKLPNDG